MADAGHAGMAVPDEFVLRQASEMNRVVLTLGFDMDVENISGPAVFRSFLSVGEPPFRVLEPGHEQDVVAPGQLSNSLLDNCPVWPSLAKRSYVKQVGARKAFHVRESSAEIAREPFNDLRSPSLRGLAAKNVFPKFPIEHDELPIDSEGGPLLGQVNAGF
jgi:hypothetical protein